MSRAVNKWRSDADCNEALLDMAAQDQLFTLGLSHFFPLHAGAVGSSEPYVWRSSVTTGGLLWYPPSGWGEKSGSTIPLLFLPM